MNIKEFMQDDKDDIEKYIDGELDKIIDCFYSFTHGYGIWEK